VKTGKATLVGPFDIEVGVYTVRCILESGKIVNLKSQPLGQGKGSFHDTYGLDSVDVTKRTKVLSLQVAEK
jgi:hypothetical protein